MSQRVEVFPVAVKAFQSALENIGGGSFAIEAASGLQEAIKATMIQEKQSTVTLTLTVAKVSDEQVSISGSSSTRLPKPKPKAGFFVDIAGGTYLPTRNRPETQILPGMNG